MFCHQEAGSAQITESTTAKLSVKEFDRFLDIDKRDVIYLDAVIRDQSSVLQEIHSFDFAEFKFFEQLSQHVVLVVHRMEGSFHSIINIPQFPTERE